MGCGNQESGMGLQRAVVTALFFAGIAAWAVAQPPGRVPDWGTAMDAVRADARVAAACDKLIAAAREVAAKPIVKRVYRFEDIGKFRSSLGERTVAMDGSPRQSWFALAKSDCLAATTIDRELPLLAVAYRWSGEEAFRARILAQLEEMTTWSPLQRPGWTLSKPSPDPVPPGFRDGNWLATGWGVRALADTLEIMPAGSVPRPLVEKIHAQLAREIASIVDDWQTRRSWFIRGNDPRTNQWIVVTEGLVRACLVLGKDTHAAEYALGVRNLIAALDAQGPQGEVYEGLAYAAMSVESLLHTARAMAVTNDRRALDHPFLHRFPTWMAHHFQPGGSWINCFDARVLNKDRCWQLLSLFLMLTNDPVARWTLNTQFSGPPDDYTGLAARGTRGESRAPTLYARYEAACRVNWRSGWAEEATGVWVRGGHALDGHDHYDRGHVNFILRGKPILIEAGTPLDYGNPEMGRLYQAPFGHNVLEVKDSKTRKMPASIRVIRLDATGSEIVVDPTPGYPDVKRWRRRATWSADRLEVIDEVAFPPDRPRQALFRWHLGTRVDVKPQGHGNRVTFSWSGVTLTLESSVPLKVATGLAPDNTVNLGAVVGQDSLHRCVIVETQKPGTAWTLKTTVTGN